MLTERQVEDFINNFEEFLSNISSGRYDYRSLELVNEALIWALHNEDSTNRYSYDLFLKINLLLAREKLWSLIGSSEADKAPVLQYKMLVNANFFKLANYSDFVIGELDLSIQNFLTDAESAKEYLLAVEPDLETFSKFVNLLIQYKKVPNPLPEKISEFRATVQDLLLNKFSSTTLKNSPQLKDNLLIFALTYRDLAILEYLQTIEITINFKNEKSVDILTLVKSHPSLMEFMFDTLCSLISEEGELPSLTNKKQRFFPERERELEGFFGSIQQEKSKGNTLEPSVMLQLLSGQEGGADTIKQLLEEIPDPNARRTAINDLNPDSKETLLHKAVKSSNIEVVNTLLDYGASFNVRDDLDHCPCEVLFELCAQKPNDKNLGTILKTFFERNCFVTEDDRIYKERIELFLKSFLKIGIAADGLSNYLKSINQNIADGKPLTKYEEKLKDIIIKYKHRVLFNSLSLEEQGNLPLERKLNENGQEYAVIGNILNLLQTVGDIVLIREVRKLLEFSGYNLEFGFSPTSFKEDFGDSPDNDLEILGTLVII